MGGALTAAFAAVSTSSLTGRELRTCSARQIVTPVFFGLGFPGITGVSVTASLVLLVLRVPPNWIVRPAIQLRSYCIVGIALLVLHILNSICPGLPAGAVSIPGFWMGAASLPALLP